MFKSTMATNDPRLLQVHSLNPFIRSISASRADMFASEIGQAPPMIGSEIRRIQTGMEQEYGKYTHMIKLPENCTIVKVIDKHSPRGMLGQTLVTSTTVVFRTVHGKYDCVVIPVSSRNHQQFGFDFVRTEKGKTLRKGQWLAKDTILAKSPSLEDSGHYKYGINARIAYMSIPEVIQDGAVISKSLANKARFKGYTSYVLSFGGGTIPLNINGDDDMYKIFPDVGEYVNPNGLVFATREISDKNNLIQLNRKNLRMKEEGDIGTYIDKVAVVTDIEVYHNRSVRQTTPTLMTDQCARYWNCTRDYYRELQNTYSEIRAEVGYNNSMINELIEPPLHNLLVRAEAVLHEPGRAGGGSQITFVNNGTPLNEWTVEITVGYLLTPVDGFKQAGDAGNKSVTVRVWEDEHMPLDASGERADIIMDGGSSVNRLNPACVYEQYINASMVATHKRLLKFVETGRRDEALQHLLDLYKTVSPLLYDLVTTKRNLQEHLDIVLRGGIYLWCPTNNPVYYPDVIETLEVTHPPCFGPVSYITGNGDKCVTKKPVLIGSIYLIFLEKIGDEYSAVSSPVLQPQGIPGKLTRADRYASPGRPQSIRALSETDVRNVQSNTDPEMVPDMLASSNSPKTHKRQTVAYLTAKTPTFIEDVLQHDEKPRSGNRITDYMSNSLLAGGFIFEYRPVKEDK